MKKPTCSRPGANERAALTELQLTQEQEERLLMVARRRRCSVAEVVQEAIDALLEADEWVRENAWHRAA